MCVGDGGERRSGDAAEPRHVRVQRPLWLHHQAGLHASQGSTVRPVCRVNRRRHCRRHRARQGAITELNDY